MNNKCVYIVEVDYELYSGGEKSKVHAIRGVYEDIDMAVEYVIANADNDFTVDDVRDALLSEGVCEVWQHPCMMWDKFASKIYMTISEEVLIEKQ